jgi:ATP-binding cassette subfamily F protein uup
VTHDRFLFDRVSTVVLALDGTGGAQVFADYQQWEDAQRGQSSAAEKPTATPVRAKPTPSGIKRLTYAEQREWAQMETAILAAEQALEACRVAADDPSIAANAEAVHQRYTALQAAQEHVDRLYARWAELEEKQTQS